MQEHYGARKILNDLPGHYSARKTFFFPTAFLRGPIREASPKRGFFAGKKIFSRA